MNRCSFVLLALPVFAAFTSAGAAHGQEAPGTAIVTVSAAETGSTLTGAQVSVAGTGIRALTEQDGIARLVGMPPGTQTIEVRRIGYAAALRLVQVSASGTARLSVALRVEVVALPEIRVQGRRLLSHLERVGFARRQGNAPGKFLSRAEIEKRRPRFLSDMLRTVPGVALTSTRMGGDSRATMSRSATGGGRRCPIQYFVDGVQTLGFNIDDVSPRDVEGLEIYKGGSQIPAEFNRGSAMCGVILIWTRVGR